MHLTICVACGHPANEHVDDGCNDLLWDEPGANAYPDLCPCVKTEAEVYQQHVPPVDDTAARPPACPRGGGE